MLYLFVLVILICALGLRRGRKARKKAFDFQRVMGDAIAIRQGKFIQRWFRKQAQKRAGRVINKWKR